MTAMFDMFHKFLPGISELLNQYLDLVELFALNDMTKQGTELTVGQGGA